MVMPKAIYVISDLWHRLNGCDYTKCSEVVYGDIDSIIGQKIFCKYHYDLVSRFLGGYGSDWQMVYRERNGNAS